MKKILFASAILLATSIQAQSLKKANGLSKGLQISKTAKSVVVNSMEMMGQQINTDINNEVVTIYQVKDITAAGTDIDITLAKMKMEMEVMGQNMSFDSEKPDESNPMGAKMKEMIGKTTSISVSKEGKIIGKKSADAASASDAIAQLIGGGSGGLNEGATLDIIMPLTKDEVKVGETWIDSSGNEEGKNVTVYTLKSITNDVAELTYTGTVAINKKGENQGMEMLTKLSGTTTGTLLVDAKSLVIKKRTAKVEMKGTIDMMGMSAPSSMTTTLEETIQ